MKFFKTIGSIDSKMEIASVNSLILDDALMSYIDKLLIINETVDVSE
ncbi:hypothetical protein [Halalkalibacter flavus]